MFSNSCTVKVYKYESIYVFRGFTLSIYNESDEIYIVHIRVYLLNYIFCISVYCDDYCMSYIFCISVYVDNYCMSYTLL